MKYIILIYAIADLLVVYQLAQKGDASSSVINAIIIGLLSYVSGRLHRVKQNIIFVCIVSILILQGAFDGFTTGRATIGIITRLVIWIDICVAYILRYKEHKEAGLMDAPKN